jgi:hypothetical protein
MIQSGEKLKSANWEITAIGLHCDYIDDFITVKVNRDWLAECPWCIRYKMKTAKGNKKKFGKAIMQKIEKCVGPDCPIIAKYRDKLIEEELGKK